MMLFKTLKEKINGILVNYGFDENSDTLDLIMSEITHELEIYLNEANDDRVLSDNQ